MAIGEGQPKDPAKKAELNLPEGSNGFQRDFLKNTLDIIPRPRAASRPIPTGYDLTRRYDFMTGIRLAVSRKGDVQAMAISSGHDLFKNRLEARGIRKKIFIGNRR